MTDLDKEKLIKQLEEEAEKLHSSTRTDISFLSPFHNYLRTKSGIYYKWSSNPKASAIHKAGALAFFISLIIFLIIQLFI